MAIVLQSITVFILLYLVNSNLFLNKKNYISVLILSGFLVTVNLVGSLFGFLGSAVSGIIGLLVIMRALGYDLGGAILFSLGLGLLNFIVLVLIGGI